MQAKWLMEAVLIYGFRSDKRDRDSDSPWMGH